ncbi:MAG: DUF192 domain-containing protein [Candidatus Omnitrophica bacterium]|nr:DUF192 domain-containing protein [Candidatus Omnitrophota bacterium]
MYFRVINQSNNALLFSKAQKKIRFFSKLCGLMFRKEISEENALIFYNASAIHTFFMRFPIDVVFLNKNMRVLRICQGLKPSRMVFCKGAFCVIECVSGLAAIKKVKCGDVLAVQNNV